MYVQHLQYHLTETWSHSNKVWSPWQRELFTIMFDQAGLHCFQLHVIKIMLNHIQEYTSYEILQNTSSLINYKPAKIFNVVSQSIDSLPWGINRWYCWLSGCLHIYQLWLRSDIAFWNIFYCFAEIYRNTCKDRNRRNILFTQETGYSKASCNS